MLEALWRSLVIGFGGMRGVRKKSDPHGHSHAYPSSQRAGPWSSHFLWVGWLSISLPKHRGMDLQVSHLIT